MKSTQVIFGDIINNSEYYEVTESGKRFFICAGEGYIPISKIDGDCKFIDLHCKCGQAIIPEEFSNWELIGMEMSHNYGVGFICEDKS